MRDGHLLRRAGREFAKNLIWMVVAFGAGRHLGSHDGSAAGGDDGLRQRRVGRQSAIVTGVVIGSNAHDETPSVGSSTTISIRRVARPVATGAMAGLGWWRRS